MGAINVKQLGTARQMARNKNLSVHQPIPDKGQVVNSDGGFVWQVNDWDKLTRFLILGVEGGTYYVKEPDLLKSNTESVKACIAADGVRTVREIVDVSVNGRAYRNDPAIYALALASHLGSQATKEAVYAAVTDVCRTGTHLYHFAMYCDALRGWGRGLKNAVGRWFTEKDADRLAYQMVKYQQRDGWSAADMLRKAHPVAKDSAQDAVLRWVVAGMDGLGARQVKRKRGAQESVRDYVDVKAHLPKLIEVFEQAKTASEKELVKLIVEHGLPREGVPTEKLNSLPVWEALLQKMPLTAMIRNLGKMTSIGLLKPMSEGSKLVSKRLRDAEYLKKSRVHPLAVLVASKVYANNRGLKGSLTWTHVPQLLTALDEAFYATFGNVVPAGKPLLIALDVSGSMSGAIAGSVVSSAEAVAAMSLVWASTEPDVHVFGFANTFRELGIRKGMTLAEATRRAQDMNFGSTDVSLAFQYAIQHRIKVGGFVTMTDSETNSGRHPAMALREYRERFVGDARSVVVATTSTGFTVNDPTDKWGLDVAGFDTSVPNVVTDFIRGAPAKAETDEEVPVED